MKKHFYIILTTLYSCTNSFQLKEGDILFQDLDSSPLCDAIELVRQVKPLTDNSINITTAPSLVNEELN